MGDYTLKDVHREIVKPVQKWLEELIETISVTVKQEPEDDWTEGIQHEWLDDLEQIRQFICEYVLAVTEDTRSGLRAAIMNRLHDLIRKLIKSHEESVTSMVERVTDNKWKPLDLGLDKKPDVDVPGQQSVCASVKCFTCGKDLGGHMVVNKGGNQYCSKCGTQPEEGMTC
jgi:hypothetical protein